MTPKPEPTTENLRSRKAGSVLATPEPGDEVVISGMSGRFAQSDNVYELRDNLFNKVDLITTNESRWSNENIPPGVPKYSGKINNINKFDASFFGIHPKVANMMDPMVRVILEKTFEAIIDAGMHPDEIRGTRTGIFIGTSHTETEYYLLQERTQILDMKHTLVAKSLFGPRIGYWLGVDGPIYTVDSACSSTGYAIDHAYRNIREGNCDMAIVAGSQLNLNPHVALHFARLGVLNKNGKLSCFDADSDGYTRAEGAISMLLQKAKHARRNYAQIIHVKSNCDGFKEQGITFPSTYLQQDLLREFYNECGVDPAQLSYIEAHGTGTKMGDPEELNAIDSVLTKGRTTPLLMGSVKSNVGHAEPAACSCSVAKVIIAMESGYIPPNNNFKKPGEKMTAIIEGRIKVVAEKTKWNIELAGINCFGFGGSNSHILLKANTKNKINKGIPKDDLPRLVYCSGRTPEAIDSIIDNLEANSMDVEYIRLLHESFKYNISGHVYRGVIVLSKKGMIFKGKQFYDNNPKPVTLLFSGIGSQWAGMGSSLLKMPVFAEAIERCHSVVLPFGINLKDIISNKNAQLYNDIVNVSVGITAIQIGLINILNTIKLKADHIIGYSIGEIACAYCDNYLTLEEAIMTSYYIAQASISQQNEQILINNLKKLIPSPKRRSNKWITTTTDKEIAKYFSPEYLLHTIFHPVKYENIFPKKSIIIEVAPSGYVQNLLKETFTDQATISLLEKSQTNLETLTAAIGKLYLLGCNPRVEHLYPNISFPVSRGTQMISPYIKWNHVSNWFVLRIDKRFVEQIYTQNVSIPIGTEMKYVSGHNIDGRILYPATGYIMLVWERIAMFLGNVFHEISVMFEDVRFIKAVHIPASMDRLHLLIAIQKGSGDFEILEDNQTVVKGKIKVLSETDFENVMCKLPLPYIKEDKNYKDLTQRDIYKELRLRGYKYSGMFRGLVSSDATNTKGEIKWEDNYITFMDNMLQMKILQKDTRGLFVPTKIRRIVINTHKHKNIIAKLTDTSNTIPVYNYKDLDTIVSGGIEIQGLKASPISRKKHLGEPVLETYKFIPNITNKLSLEQSIRVAIQVLLENVVTNKIKVVELLDETICEDQPILCLIIQSVLNDLPLIQADLNILTKKSMETMNGITVSDTKLSAHSDSLLVIASKIFGKSQVLGSCFDVLTEGGLVITRESLNINTENIHLKDIDVVLVHKLKNEQIVVLKKNNTTSCKTVVNVNNDVENFDWLPVLQKSVNNDPNTIVYSQDEELNGIIGLVNCIRKEPGTNNVKSVFIMDKNAPKFDVQDEFYARQLRKGLGMNVLKNGVWGTYRHLLLEKQTLVQAEHAFVSAANHGDISSLRWVEGNLSAHRQLPAAGFLVHVYYSALNFRDVMTASGRLATEVLTEDRALQDCVQGIEFSGKLSNGNRVMGITDGRALGTLVLSNPLLMWDVPNDWSLEDAATVPVVYATVLYAFVSHGYIHSGQTVLIHAGSGGIGQAAINVALFYGCTVYTTVGSQKKRDFIKSTWPQIKDNQIGNSRDKSFEAWLMTETNGRGVDLILNALSEEMLQASVRCLAKYGKFLEIGKFDLVNDSPLSLELLKKQASYHGIMLDLFFTASSELIQQIHSVLHTAIKEGAVKPLARIVAKSDEVVPMFRYMAAGKHIGKVLIQIREDNSRKELKPIELLMPAVPRYNASPEGSYIMFGGLGGFGLELTDWLILRGVRNIVLVSRNGISNGYQSMRIKLWKSYGVQVLISTEDISSFEGCKKIIEQAITMGPVEGIFNLAVILKDAVLENQTKENFSISFNTKAIATKYLDQISRKTCPDLRLFVVFSSVSCGRGNAGQTNYGMSNSVMERICEQRKAAGYPALAVQWGAVGDVGLVAEMQEDNKELVIGGTLQQKIFNCLYVLDQFLKQSDPIVSSMIVAEKKNYFGGGAGMIEAICEVLGIKDVKSVSPHVKLSELGMDSITSNEIKQLLETDFNIFLTQTEIRSLTITKLQEIEASKEPQNRTNIKEGNTQQRTQNNLQVLVQTLGDEKTAHYPTVVLSDHSTESRKIIILPGIEGVAIIFKPLAANLISNSVGLQLNSENLPDDIHSMAMSLTQSALDQLEKGQDFTLVAHSWGTIIALELAAELESRGHRGNLILLDGSPDTIISIMNNFFEDKTEDEFQNEYLTYIFQLYMQKEVVIDVKSIYETCTTWEEKMTKLLDTAPLVEYFSKEYLKSKCLVVFKKIKAILNYTPNVPKLKSKITLIKPETTIYMNTSEDFGLSAFSELPIDVVMVEGDHMSLIGNINTACTINDILSRSALKP